MSLTLGEKLRQAREERGITISEVAEQTRISALYLACIENDDYRTLPGGIFNKGFIKSFAKYVGVDEQEALQDYAKLVANQDNEIVDEPKTYRPQVLTDDNNSSRWTTIIFAGVILALMVAGVLTLVRYLEPMTAQLTANSNSSANSNSVANLTLANSNSATAPTAPPVNSLKIEIRAIKSPVSLSSTADGQRVNALLTVDKPKVFEPKESLRLSYAKAKAQNIQITINDKQIDLPTAPENPNRNVIEFEITKENAPQILESGRISYDGMPSPR